MRVEPAPRASPCVALLDDMSAEGAHSRLYADHVGTLSLTDHAALPAMLDEVERLLARGLQAVGVFTYELGERLQSVSAEFATKPLAQFLLFEDCRILDEVQVLAWLRARGSAANAGVANVHADVTQAGFEAAVRRIQSYIAAGDTYQVNYTYRLHFDAYGEPAGLYARLRQRQRVPYGAFIVLPDGGSVLSLSPELFVRHAAGELIARPMKGTAAAGGDAAENLHKARALSEDPKNRAENVMIVDLLRNDLGRVAKIGSVRVPSLFQVDRFGDVLQMTSTVRAEVSAGCTLADTFTAIYPCGSITGAPKRRTMQIIAELEKSPRGIYTGAIGWFEAPGAGRALGDFCLSVPIRTLVLQPPRGGVRPGEMGVGAGIVADSDPQSEFEECRLKAKFLTGLAHEFELVETMHATREEGCRYLQRHLTRLADSAQYFGIPLDVPQLASFIRDSCSVLDGGKEYRLRIALRPAGPWSIQASLQAPLVEPVRVFISPHVLHAGDLFLRHKSTVRALLDAGWEDAESRGGFDSLLFNERGELAQGGRTNVFVKLDGRWYTPPVSSGALPGVMRSMLLADARWKATERVLTRADLRCCEEIVVCSSLRGAVRATLHEEELVG